MFFWTRAGVLRAGQVITLPNSAGVFAGDLGTISEVNAGHTTCLLTVAHTHVHHGLSADHVSRVVLDVDAYVEVRLDVIGGPDLPPARPAGEPGSRTIPRDVTRFQPIARGSYRAGLHSVPRPTANDRDRDRPPHPAA